jgi:hypothetical protein
MTKRIAKRVTVAVCRKCEEHACLERILSDRDGVEVESVRCQKICHGPVAGLVVDGRMEWFERVDGVKQIAALVRMTRREPQDRIPKPLRRRRVKGRAGKVRR